MNLFRAGLTLETSGKFELAIEAFKGALEKGYENPMVYFHRGFCCLNINLFSEACNDLNKSISMFEKCWNEEVDYSVRVLYADALYYRGRTMESLRRFEEAILDFRKASSILPLSKHYLQLGYCFMVLKKDENALKNFNKTIEMSLSEKENDIASIAFFNRGVILLTGMNMYKDSIVDFTRSIELNQKELDCIKIYFQRGTANLSLNLHEEAISDFSKVLDLCRKKENILKMKLTPDELKYKLSSLNNRGLCYDKLKRFEESNEDYFEASIEKEDRNNYDVLCNLGVSLSQQGKNEDALKHLMRAYKLKPKSATVIFCIAEFFLRKGDLREAHLWMKKVITLYPREPDIYRMRSRVVMVSEPRRSSDDLGKFMRLSSDTKQNPYEMDEVNEVPIMRLSTDHFTHQPKSSKFHDIKTIIKTPSTARLKAMNAYELMFWSPFEKDDVENYKNEEVEMKVLSELLIRKKFKDLDVFETIGRGAFGSTYICRVRKTKEEYIGGIFVMKIYHQMLLSKKKRKEMLNNDNVRICYHPNIAPILATSRSASCVIKLKQLPDYAEFWKKRKRSKLRSGIVFMKYHHKDLDKYVKERKRATSRVCFHPNYFTSLEICYCLRGLLRGVHHLHENLIVHRDLHTGNVFVDEKYGRIYIGDFGCSLDLKDNKDGFLVHKNEEILYNLNGSYMELNRGGCDVHIAPEISDFNENKDEFLNYEKSDLFSVGMIGFFLERCLNAPNGKEYLCGCAYGYETVELGGESDIMNIVRGRKQEDYNREWEKLGSGWIFVHSEVSELIKRLLVIDPGERIGYEESLLSIDEVISNVEKENRVDDSVDYWWKKWDRKNQYLKDISAEKYLEGIEHMKNLREGKSDLLKDNNYEHPSPKKDVSFSTPNVQNDNIIPTERICSNCKKSNPVKRCAQCLAVYYCDRKCQISDWKTHRKKCSKSNNKK